jgi:GTP-binding protein EngB required for normal cell division
MTSVLEGASALVTRGTDLADRVHALDAAVSAAHGHLDDPTLVAATETVARAGERLRLSADHTIVALAGATGSGKSSTFNALVGLELASVGVRRPTTSWATACTWGSTGAAGILDWLGIPPRHQVVRDSMLDTGREAKDLEGLVLLDLPDHDSTEVTHHLEVDRLVQLADLLVWVLDPQKYADAAVHDGFLRPLAAHKDVMLVVLNHIDEVAEDRRASMVADLRRLLDADGLHGIPLMPVSAVEGIGIDELRRTIVGRVAQKAATRARISTNITEAADALAAVSGMEKPPVLADADRSGLRDAVAEAAGVPLLVDAVQTASLRSGARATSWPPAALVSRLRPDPMRRLDVDLRATGTSIVSASRAGMPAGEQVQEVRAEAAVRELTDRLSEHLARPWVSAVRRATVAGLPQLEESLRATVAAADLQVARAPWWSRVVQFVQWVLLGAAIAGAGWWAAHAAGVKGTVPKYAGVPAPVVLLGGGLLAGILLAMACRALVLRSARRRTEQTARGLRAEVDAATDRFALEPLAQVLDAYRVTTDGLRAARG